MSTIIRAVQVETAKYNIALGGLLGQGASASVYDGRVLNLSSPSIWPEAAYPKYDGQDVVVKIPYNSVEDQLEHHLKGFQDPALPIYLQRIIVTADNYQFETFILSKASGRNLAQILSQEPQALGPDFQSTGLSITYQLLHACGVLYSRGARQGDLQEHNIMFDRERGGRAAFVDFGNARQMHPNGDLPTGDIANHWEDERKFQTECVVEILRVLTIGMNIFSRGVISETEVSETEVSRNILLDIFFLTHKARQLMFETAKTEILDVSQKLFNHLNHNDWIKWLPIFKDYIFPAFGHLKPKAVNSETLQGTMTSFFRGALTLCSLPIFDKVRITLEADYELDLKGVGMERVKALNMMEMRHASAPLLETQLHAQSTQLTYQEILRFEQYSYRLSLINSEKRERTDLIQASKYAYVAVEWCSERLARYFRESRKDAVDPLRAHLEIKLSFLYANEARIGEMLLNLYHANGLPCDYAISAPYTYLTCAMNLLEKAKKSFGVPKSLENPDDYAIYLQIQRCNCLEMTYKQDRELLTGAVQVSTTPAASPSRQSVRRVYDLTKAAFHGLGRPK